MIPPALYRRIEHVDTVTAARRVLAATDSWFPRELDPSAVTTPELALAGLARCRRLLEGMLQMADSPDLCGGYARALFETWLWSVYLLLDPDTAYRRMEATDRTLLAKMAKQLLPMLEDRHDPVADRLRKQTEDAVAQLKEGDNELGVADVANCVRSLLRRDGDPNAEYPVETYAHLFRSESYVSVHGGLGAMKQHMLASGAYTGRIEGAPSYRDPEDRRFALCVGMVLVLAHRVARGLGIEHQSLDQFAADWNQHLTGS
jgi:hypothetical protein